MCECGGTHQNQCNLAQSAARFAGRPAKSQPCKCMYWLLNSGSRPTGCRSPAGRPMSPRRCSAPCRTPGSAAQGRSKNRRSPTARSPRRPPGSKTPPACWSKLVYHTVSACKGLPVTSTANRVSSTFGMHGSRLRACLVLVIPPCASAILVSISTAKLTSVDKAKAIK